MVYIKENLMSKLKRFLNYNRRPFITCLLLLFIILIQLVLFSSIFTTIMPLSYVNKPILFFDLLGQHTFFPVELLLYVQIANLLLLWTISKNILEGFYSLLPSFLLSISPWTIYLASANSFYIYLLFFILVMIYGLILIAKSKPTLGTICFLIGFALSIYSSYLMLLTIPIFIVSFMLLKVVPANKIIRPLIFASISLLPLLFISLTHLSSIKNISRGEIGAFTDPGLLNSINYQRGSAEEDGFGILAKVADNKYVNYSEFVLLKSIKNLAPSSYFTSQEKLLGFSYSPPIYLGFVIPFFYGIFVLLDPKAIKIFPKLKKLPQSVFLKILLLSCIFLLPVILSKQIVDLNRLVLLSPIIFTVTSIGFIAILKQKKRYSPYLILFFLSLIIFQMGVTFKDIQTKESTRVIKYYGQSYKISGQ